MSSIDGARPKPLNEAVLEPCTQQDPELFFPIGNTGPAILQIEEAKAVCATCPVRIRTSCFELALRNGYEGVWGGTSDDERRALKREAINRRRRRVRAATAGVAA